MNPDSRKESFFEREGVQSVLASLICIVLGLAVGYLVLFLINPAGAGRAMSSILKNFLYFPKRSVALEYFGSTLAKRPRCPSSKSRLATLASALQK